MPSKTNQQSTSYPDLSVLPSHIRHIIAQASTGPNAIPFRARTSHLHSTWAGTFSSIPELYIQPETLQEIEHVVSLAQQCRRRIVTVGSGHSPSDLTCTSSWLVNLDRFNAISSIDPDFGLVTMKAGIRLYQLCDALERVGLAVPNLGSINEQSIAGVISTGTHGSSLWHGLLSERIVGLKIVLADGRTRSCGVGEDEELFRAALLSLGALGIIVEVSFRAVPAFSVRWNQTIDSDQTLFAAWQDGRLWNQAHYVRVWWFPYMRRAVTWKGDMVEARDIAMGNAVHRDPPTSWYDGKIGYYVYHNLLFVARYIPRILPWVEWFVFGMQYGFRNGEASKISGLQPSRKALLMNCLYSQYVNEWAIPLEKGPEALCRLAAWLQGLKPSHKDYVDHGIPFDAEGLYVHSPVEVRVTDTTKSADAKGNRPWLDPTVKNGPTLYLNAIMYRPYHMDPGPNKDRYYQGFEWLMRDLGGRPHWAKNFTATAQEVEAWYGEDLECWRKIRHEADPYGMFVGPWHRRLLLGGSDEAIMLEDEERELSRGPARNGGVLWQGAVLNGSQGMCL